MATYLWNSDCDTLLSCTRGLGPHVGSNSATTMFIYDAGFLCRVVSFRMVLCFVVLYCVVFEGPDSSISIRTKSVGS